MKLSKNKLNKIIKNKNHSRKKKDLRKIKTKSGRSKRKNHNKKHMKHKTIKIYFGGNTSVSNTKKSCKYSSIPDNEKMTSEFVKKTDSEQITFVTKYFNYNNNLECRNEARNELMKYLQELYISKKEDSIPQIQKLKEIWEINIDPTTLNTNERTKYMLPMNEIKKESEQPKKTGKSKEELDKEAKVDLDKIKNMCSSLVPLSNEPTSLPLLKAMSNEIKSKYSSSLIAKPDNLVKNIKDLNFYRVETTSDGDCLYSSIVFGLLYKQVGNWDKIQGWVPKKVETGGKCNYIGNLRNVLSHYICKNVDSIDFIGKNVLKDTLSRIQSSGSSSWGEDPEIKLLAKMFNVCIGIFKGSLQQDKFIQSSLELYDSNGYAISEYDKNNIMETIKDKCGENMIYIIEWDNIHFQAVIPIIESSAVDMSEKINSTQIIDNVSCDINSISRVIPDKEEEALDMLTKLENMMIHCHENDIDKKIEILDFMDKYINDFRDKFGKDPIVISEGCKSIFETLDYNSVPMNKDEASKKLLNFLQLLDDDEKKNDKKCLGSINAAMDIYYNKYLQMYPEEMKEESDSKTKLIINEPQDENANSKDILSDDDIRNIFEKPFGVDEEPDLLLKDKRLSRSKLIKLLTHKTNPNSVQLRKVIGFPDLLTMSQIQESYNLDSKSDNLVNKSPNVQIFSSLFKSYDDMRKDNNNNNNMNSNDDFKGGAANLNLEDFKKFVNCGQYRDKSKNIFDCKSIKIPTAGESQSTPGESQSTPGESQSTVGESQSTVVESQSTPDESQSTPDVSNKSSKNIKLEINEQPYSGEIKRVDLSIFVPNNSEVIVKNYAKNTESETINSLSIY